MPTRRINDAQAERIAWGLRDAKTRVKWARDDAGLKPGQPLPAKGTIERRVYDTAMRRYQRYVTEGEQKRNIANAPKAYQADMRAKVRRIPPPPMPPRIKPPPLPQEPPRVIPPKKRVTGPGFRDDIPPVQMPIDYIKPKRRRHVDLYLIQAVIAFHDGDVHETARELGLRRPGEVLLELATQAVQIDGDSGYVRLEQAIRDLLDDMGTDELEDVQDFSKLLHDLPDWEIEMIFADLRNGDTTFADWIDAYRKDGLSLDTNDSWYWALWRDVYKRLTA